MAYGIFIYTVCVEHLPVIKYLQLVRLFIFSSFLTLSVYHFFRLFWMKNGNTERYKKNPYEKEEAKKICPQWKSRRFSAYRIRLPACDNALDHFVFVIFLVFFVV